MEIVCAWCGMSLSDTSTNAMNSEKKVSHGMCKKCFSRLTSESGTSLREFLKALEVPIFLVGEDTEVVFSDYAEHEGLLSGDVLECAHARLPGGCGKTEHCAACTIRNAVTSTYDTGESILGVPGYQQIVKNGVPVRVPISVSTVMSPDGVVLKVEKRAER